VVRRGVSQPESGGKAGKKGLRKKGLRGKGLRGKGLRKKGLRGKGLRGGWQVSAAAVEKMGLAEEGGTGWLAGVGG
jgi:hypothetical protein